MGAGKVILLIFLLFFFLTPIHSLNVAIISFEKDLSENLEVLTADKTKVLTTLFSAEKNETKEVPIFISNVVNLSNATIFVKYDKNIIEPETILNGDFNFSYIRIDKFTDKIKITLNSNKSFTGDFLLASVIFRAIGDEGETSSLTFEVEKLLANSKEVPYKTIDGVFNIKVKEFKEKRSKKIADVLEEFIKAENKSKFAGDYNLEIEDDKVKVEITTDEGKEQKEVNVDELKNLTENQSIIKIEPYRGFNWGDYIIPIVLLFIILGLALIYKGLR